MSKTLYLIDGTNYAFRAFFAIPPMNNSRGFPTNALHGFTYMLLNLLKQQKPDYLTVAFDAKGPTFRKDQFDDYKAQRKPIPQELLEQMPYFRKVCEALRVPYFELTGYEADDIVATLVRRTEGMDITIRIISMDKDLMQLVDARVNLWDTLRDKIYDVAGVEEKWGVPPTKLRDLLALTGDTSDNIPGVPGIGPKKARDLLTEFESVPHLLENLDKVRNQKIRETLQANVAAAQLSLELVTLHYDVPLDMPLETLQVQEPDPFQSYTLFRELEFKRLTRDYEAIVQAQGHELPNGQIVDSSAQATMDFAAKDATLLQDGAASGAVSGNPTSSPASSGLSLQVSIVEEPAQLASLAGSLRECNRIALRALEMEGSGEPLAGIGIAVSPSEGWFIPLSGREPGWIEAVKTVLRSRLGDSRLPKFGHNLKRDMRRLGAFGLELKGVGGDTELGAYVLNPSRTEQVIGDLCDQFLGRRLTQQNIQLRLAEEAATILAIHEKMLAEIESVEMGPLYREIEVPLIPILSGIERIGIRVDVPHLQVIGVELERRIGEAEARIHGLAGEKFNPNSPKQLQNVLFEKLKLPVSKKTKTGPSTDQEVLETLSEIHELPAEILAYRSLVKLKGTYVDALPKLVVAKTSRIHTTLNQAGTATGRLSSVDPNLQNIPIRGEEGKRIREAFIASEGCKLVSADYSQIELRLLAHFCGDETLIHAFTHGLDIHAATAADMFGIPIASVTTEMRRSAKAINFGILYGMGAFRLARELKITRKEAEAFIERYFGRYARVKAYLDATLQGARQNGFVTTLYKRRRYLPELTASNFSVRQAAERIANNTPIQGSAADIIKIAMKRVSDALSKAGLKARMLLQVHDELVFDVPVEELDVVKSLVKTEMEGVAQLSVPLTVEVGVGDNWAAAH